MAVSRAVWGQVRQEGPLSDCWTCPVSPLSWALGVDAGAAPGSQEQPQEAQRPGPPGGKGPRVTLPSWRPGAGRASQGMARAGPDLLGSFSPWTRRSPRAEAPQLAGLRPVLRSSRSGTLRAR